MKPIVAAASLALCLACVLPAVAQSDQTLARLQEELARMPGAGQKERDDVEWRILIAKIEAKRAADQGWSLADFFNSNPAPPAMAPPKVQVAQPAQVTIPLAPTFTPPPVSSAVLSPMPGTPAATRLAPGTTIDRRTASERAPAAPPVSTPPRVAASAAPAMPAPIQVKAAGGMDAAVPAEAVQRLEIKLPNGIALTVPSDISPEALKRLTSALSSQ